jgi:hypothetical protein
MPERGSVTRSNLKIETVGMMLRLTEPRSLRYFLYVSIRVYPCLKQNEKTTGDK